MKKVIVWVLVLTVALCLTACGGEESAPETTAAPQVAETVAAPAETSAQEETEPQAAQSNEPYSITLEGAMLTPGQIYDASVMPEPLFVYQVPSCAIEGTDNVYSFETFEITAFDDGTNEIIYAVALTDPNASTDEGLMLGDKAERVIELYGENYEESGTAMVYTGGETRLSVIIQNGYVVDIEFSWVTE